MQHQRLDQLRAHAVVAEAPVLMTREQRLRRWADLLGRVGSQPLNPLRWVEFYAESERRRLRRDGSPIALALADPVLRAQGLSGDTLGDAQLFFGLSDDEAHALLCDCHYQGTLTGRSAARRVRGLAREGVFGWMMRAFS